MFVHSPLLLNKIFGTPHCFSCSDISFPLGAYILAFLYHLGNMVLTVCRFLGGKGRLAASWNTAPGTLCIGLDMWQHFPVILELAFSLRPWTAKYWVSLATGWPGSDALKNKLHQELRTPNPSPIHNCLVPDSWHSSLVTCPHTARCILSSWVASSGFLMPLASPPLRVTGPLDLLSSHDSEAS